MLKYNTPAPKGPLASANTRPPSAPAQPAPQPKMGGSEDKKPDRPFEGSRPRNRSPRRARRPFGNHRGGRRSRSRHRPAATINADTLVDKRVRDERMSAWLAGGDSKGPLRDKCKNCYIGLGAHVPRHVGRSRQELGNR